MNFMDDFDELVDSEIERPEPPSDPFYAYSRGRPRKRKKEAIPSGALGLAWAVIVLSIFGVIGSALLGAIASPAYFWGVLGFAVTMLIGFGIVGISRLDSSV